MAVPVQITFGQAFGMAITARAAEDELEQAVRDHARVVFQIAYSVLRNHADAEDATQEVFLRAVKHRAKLREIEDRKAWLARIAWRVAIDRKRQHVPTAMTADEAANDLTLERLCASGAPADEVAASRQMLLVTEQLIASLPEDLREVAVLSTVEELTTREVAEMLGIPEPTVRTRLFRARQLLREKLTARLAAGKHAGGLA